MLWSYRTTPHVGTGHTSFKFVYGMEIVLPQELLIETPYILCFNTEKNVEDLQINLDLIEEKRYMVALHQTVYKANIEKYYNKRVK